LKKFFSISKVEIPAFPASLSENSLSSFSSPCGHPVIAESSNFNQIRQNSRW